MLLMLKYKVDYYRPKKKKNHKPQCFKQNLSSLFFPFTLGRLASACCFTSQTRSSLWNCMHFSTFNSGTCMRSSTSSPVEEEVEEEPWPPPDPEAELTLARSSIISLRDLKMERKSKFKPRRFSKFKKYNYTDKLLSTLG